MTRIFLTVIAWIFGIVLILVLITITPIDNSDYRQNNYYTQTLSRIQNLELAGTENDIWLSGWASTNITPAEPVSLVGYKPRGEYQFVQDSSYVKSLLIGNGEHIIGILNYELLIIHPYLAGQVKEAITREALPIDHIIFTATHTHSGLGGYIPGIMGRIAFGGFKEEVVSLIVRQTIIGLKEALSSMDTVSITYRKTPAPDGVANRLIENGPEDPYIRQMIFEKTDSSKAIFYTYSAHATGLHSRFMGLSGDYPFYLNSALIEDGYDFALFASGAVGSHRPEVTGRDVEDIISYAGTLNETLLNTDPANDMILTGPFRSGSVQMSLPTPHFRISDQIRLRPWLFNLAFGETIAHFDVTLIGNTLLISSSGEVSGVFYEDWERHADIHDLNLIITTFNGGYIGYITPDEHYGLKHHEVRDTHWFGPQIGSFYQEIVKLLIIKASEEK